MTPGAVRSHLRTALKFACVLGVLYFLFAAYVRSKKARKLKWSPIESTAEAFTALTRALLGLSVTTTSALEYRDVLSLTPNAEDSATCCAVVVISRDWDNASSLAPRPKRPSDPIFMKQTIANSCGSIACLHVLANSEPLWRAAHPTSELDGTLRELRSSSSADDAGGTFAADARIATCHAAVAGQRRAGGRGRGEGGGGGGAVATRSFHYVTFVCVDGTIWELDSLAPAPINRGACAPNELLGEVLQVARAKAAVKGGKERLALLSVHVVAKLL